MTNASIDFIALQGVNSLDSAVREIRDINRERIPFVIVSTTGEDTFFFKDVFIELVGIAIDTDVVQDMSKRELLFWMDFTVYESVGTGINPVNDSQYLALDTLLMAMYNYEG